jgi:hypothetical protein
MNTFDTLFEQIMGQDATKKAKQKIADAEGIEAQAAQDEVDGKDSTIKKSAANKLKATGTKELAADLTKKAKEIEAQTKTGF